MVFVFNLLKTFMSRPSPYANQVVDKIIDAANELDPVAVNDFFTFAIQMELTHLDLIRPTLSNSELLRRHRALSQGTILLTLFNHFSAQKLGKEFNGFAINDSPLSEG